LDEVSEPSPVQTSAGKRARRRSGSVVASMPSKPPLETKC